MVSFVSPTFAPSGAALRLSGRSGAVLDPLSGMSKADRSRAPGRADDPQTFEIRSGASGTSSASQSAEVPEAPATAVRRASLDPDDRSCVVSSL